MIKVTDETGLVTKLIKVEVNNLGELVYVNDLDPSLVITKNEEGNLEVESDIEEQYLLVNNYVFFQYTPEFAIDEDFQAWVDEIIVQGSTVPEPFFTRLNRAIVYSKLDGNWSGVEFIWCLVAGDAGIAEADRKIWAKTDMKNPANKFTYINDYSGSNQVGIGSVGNATTYGIDTPFNMSTATKMAQNAARLSMLMLNTTQPDSSSWFAGSADAGFTQFNVIGRPYPSQAEFMINTDGINNSTYIVPKGNQRCWLTAERTGSTTHKNYLNKGLVDESPVPSMAPLNFRMGLHGAFGNNTFLASYNDNSKIGLVMGSDLTVDHWQFFKRFHNEVFKPLGGESYFKNNAFAIGDSILSNGTLGSYGLAYKTALNTLADNWIQTNLTIPNDTIVNILSRFNAKILTAYDSMYDKNVAIISGMTNDLANGPSGGNGSTGSVGYTNMRTLISMVKALGFDKVYVVGVCGRTVPGGAYVGQVIFDAQVAIYHGLMLADFTVPHGTIPNLYLPAGADDCDGFLHIMDDPNYADPTDPTYFMLDEIHWSTLGCTNFGTTYLAPMLAN